MALFDKMKCQSLINVYAIQMEIVRNAVVTMNNTRDLFVIADPDTTGTPLEGNLVTLSSALDALKAEVEKSIWKQLIAAKVPSHRGKALEID